MWGRELEMLQTHWGKRWSPTKWRKNLRWLQRTDDEKKRLMTHHRKLELSISSSQNHLHYFSVGCQHFLDNAVFRTKQHRAVQRSPTSFFLETKTSFLYLSALLLYRHSYLPQTLSILSFHVSFCLILYHWYSILYLRCPESIIFCFSCSFDFF